MEGFYLFPRKFGFRTFISALLLVGAYFTNYRLIFIPVVVAAAEFFWAWAHKEKINAQKLDKWDKNPSFRPDWFPLELVKTTLSVLPHLLDFI